ncbi:methyl-accepting chemotaxis protein [Anaerosporobacter sp.]|uniref:methyl-accepting chemotaxis protein n=1 Tax=Anaerosporobacter sp. TaxID=1872529 RepID=UPI00286F0960|nr:methyl-accepting chemotaxis protein [Anaerosporobacter sp.]
MKASLRSKITLLVLLPAIAVGLAAIITSTNVVTKIINNEIRDQLNAASMVGIEHYQNGNAADYYMDMSGTLYKGVVQISGVSSVVDRIKEYSGIEAIFYYGDEQYASTWKDENGNQILDAELESKIHEAVYNRGETYFLTDQKIGGKTYYGYYQPIKQPSSGEIVGCFFTGKPEQEVRSQINRMRTQVFLITAAIIVISMIFVFALLLVIIKSLKRSVKELGLVAEGELAITEQTGPIKRTDEISEIAIATMKVRDSLRSVIGGIIESTDVLKESSQKLSVTAERTQETTDIVERAVSEISKGAMTQAEETTVANEHVIEMGNYIASTVSDVSQLTTRASAMNESSAEAMGILEELQESNVQTKEAIEMIYTQTNTTNISAQKIREVTNIITDIAEETSLLSLNASIEAARAGEQGRGFAVVASQIQKLAEQSDKSAKNIQNIIGMLIKDSDQAVETMEVVKDTIEKQSEKVELSRTKMVSVSKGIQNFTEGIGEIRKRTTKLDEERTYIVDAVQNLTAIAQENAASSEETSASVRELTDTMKEVSDAITLLKQITERLSAEVEIFHM